MMYWFVLHSSLSALRAVQPNIGVTMTEENEVLM